MRKTKTADEYNHQGITLARKGQFEKASQYFRQAVKLVPQAAEFWNNLGSVLNKTGQYQPAIKALKKALTLDPDFAPAHFSLGSVFLNQNKLDKALISYQKGLKINPHFAVAYNNLGIIFFNQGQLDKARDYFEKALKINPQYVLTHYNLGQVLEGQEKLDQAVQGYEKAINLDPDFVDTYNNLGLVLERLGKLDQAIASYQEALKRSPHHPRIIANLTHLFQQTCNWPAFKKASQALDKLDSGGEPPFIKLARCDNLKANLKIARRWSAYLKKRSSGLKPSFTFKNRPSKKKIHLGYLSYDFRDHAVGHQIHDLFKFHDRKQFKVFVYSYGPDDKSLYRQRIKARADKFVDVKNKSHLEAAKAIYNDQVDILIDLMGYTKGYRAEISLMRPAPIQVSYLGFTGTMASDSIDYLLTDKIITPKEEAQFYTEKFCYLPDCYQINSSQRISRKKFKRADFGLPEDSSVFCSFNSNYKIDPALFGIWIKILKRVPKSVLWLSKSNSLAEKNLKKEAKKRGLNPQRLIFTNQIPLEEHLARLPLADLALDTRLYNGGATTSNALRMGVPVITIYGKHYPSRMSSSLLTAIGLPELITYSLKEYHDLALELAENPKKLQAISKKLKANRLKMPLFNTPLFVKNLEKAYRKMRENYQNKQKPKIITITS